MSVLKLIKKAYDKLNTNNYEVPVNSIYYEIVKLIQEDEDVKSEIEKEIKDYLEHLKIKKFYEEDEVPKIRWGVHETHCCKAHNYCKYGHKKCPVILGHTKQRHPCEFCEEDALKPILRKKK